MSILEPPDEFKDWCWHFVECGDEPIIMEWSEPNIWWQTGSREKRTAEQLGAVGWKYIGTARLGPSIRPTDEEIEHLAEGIVWVPQPQSDEKITVFSEQGLILFARAILAKVLQP